MPDVQGVITTDDGAAILFSFVGYNRGVTDPFEYERRAGVAALTLLSKDERYRWVNDLFAILEADIRPEAGPEHWRIRAFEAD